MTFYITVRKYKYMYKYKNRYNRISFETFSKSVGVPRWTVRVTSVVPSL